MSEFGACVVLIPMDNDLPGDVVGGQHVTLAYFGDNELPDGLDKELLNIVARLAESYSGRGVLATKSIETFGEDAQVLTFDDGPTSEAVQIREELLSKLTPDLRDEFIAAETYPTYRPHMTLGYTSEMPAEELEVADEDIPEFIYFDAIAVWNGDDRIEFNLDVPEPDIMHYGIKRRSGRYPWGSGKDPLQRSRDFMGMVEDLRKQGLSQVEISRGLGLNTRELRENIKFANNEIKNANAAEIFKLKEKGMSNVAIGERMGMGESTVRTYLEPTRKIRLSQLDNTAARLKADLEQGKLLDISANTEQYLGVSRQTLQAAAKLLGDEGYAIRYLNIEQQGGSNQNTKTLVLAPEDMPYTEVVRLAPEKLVIPGAHSNDGGITWEEPKPPKSVSSKRLEVVYGPDGGAEKDGIIELRPGVKDLDLGNSRYAQVRIAVDNERYLKGMAVYNPDLPDGVDIRFNTNKTREDAPNKLDALKAMSDDPANPWGAVIKAGGQRGALNIVNEEGDWIKWSKNLSSQMLSKQPPELAKRQLDLTYELKKSELAEINSLTNPVLKKHLLEKFSDGADSSAVYLKAKGLPSTQNHVILPIPSMKPTEIYAPQYEHGSKVVLIRHPHGGIFEIPELTVNNRITAAQKIMGKAVDAVGINPKVAEQLSGADFDGDTVLVIPQKPGPKNILNTKPLKELKDFDPKVQYRGNETTKVMRNTQTEMGRISNLITDMTIQGATNSELARAVKHSMVVIDAEKHALNYKQSEIDNGISDLRKKYQAAHGTRGAATLISRAKKEDKQPEIRRAKASEGYPQGIDPKTGKIVYVRTGDSYVDKDGKTVEKVTRRPWMLATDDAFDLVSNNGVGTPIERVYANHANKMKALANEARKTMVNTPDITYSKTAAKTYASEVQTLTDKLKTAQKNAPLERQANLIAGALVKQKRLANPTMSKDDIKKERQKQLAIARARTGAGKDRIRPTKAEWDAIQANAISTNRLRQILRNADLDYIKELATPRNKRGLSPALEARAKYLVNAGYSQAEAAQMLGVSTSTVNAVFSG